MPANKINLEASQVNYQDASSEQVLEKPTKVSLLGISGALLQRGHQEPRQKLTREPSMTDDLPIVVEEDDDSGSHSPKSLSADYVMENDEE